LSCPILKTQTEGRHLFCDAKVIQLFVIENQDLIFFLPDFGPPEVMKFKNPLKQGCRVFRKAYFFASGNIC
jgi:hypothetical protein